jgi:hypothetical protein
MALDFDKFSWKLENIILISAMDAEELILLI